MSRKGRRPVIRKRQLDQTIVAEGTPWSHQSGDRNLHAPAKRFGWKRRGIVQVSAIGKEIGAFPVQQESRSAETPHGNAEFSLELFAADRKLLSFFFRAQGGQNRVRKCM